MSVSSTTSARVNCKHDLFVYHDSRNQPFHSQASVKYQNALRLVPAGSGRGFMSLHSRRLNSGTMVTEHGSSHFYSKYNILSVGDDSEGSAPGSDERPKTEVVRVRKLTSAHGDGLSRFPKLEECAHFHYEFVEIGEIAVSLLEDNLELDTQSEQWLYFRVVSGVRTAWTIRRTYESVHTMDAQLHRCIYSRQHSKLPELSKNLIEEEGPTRAIGKISAYMTRFSKLIDNAINCGPVLSWMEMDNRGNRLIVADNDSAINTPAIGAAHAVKKYVAQTQDELSFEVGDILSIIDKPPTAESAWWRGKKNFEVGYFPSECVELIGDKNIPSTVTTKFPPPARPHSPAPVLRKKGKFISKLRNLFQSRPSRSQLKRTGIVKERVFGCDLGEHLLNSDHEVPQVLKCCTEVLEEHGVVDGIYRLSGVTSNIQKLRNEFDEDRVPCLTDECFLQDIHSISSLLKMYFRELPNPLLTYQLYDKFTEVSHEEYGESKLIRMRNIAEQLPPPHYRTAEFLFKHLFVMAQKCSETSMNCKNLAIVWAPNLLRSKELDQQMSCGTAALHGVGLQALVTEYLIVHAHDIFTGAPLSNAESMSNISQRSPLPSRAHPPSETKSPTKLLSLAEAQEKLLSTVAVRQNYIEVGGGPSALPQYHTVIEHPKDRKARRPAWWALFSKSRSASLKDESPDNDSDRLPGRFISERDARVRNRTNGGAGKSSAANKKMRISNELSGSESAVNEKSDKNDIEFLRGGNRRSLSCDFPFTNNGNISPPIMEADIRSLHVLSGGSQLRSSNASSDNEVFVSSTERRNLDNFSSLHIPSQGPPETLDDYKQFNSLPPTFPNLSNESANRGSFSTFQNSNRISENRTTFSNPDTIQYSSEEISRNPLDCLADSSPQEELKVDVDDLESVYIPPPSSQGGGQYPSPGGDKFATVIKPPPIPGLYIDTNAPIMPPKGMYVRLSSSGTPSTPMALDRNSTSGTPNLSHSRKSSAGDAVGKSPMFHVRKKLMSLEDDGQLSSWRLSDSLQSCAFVNEFTSAMDKKFADDTSNDASRPTSAIDRSNLSTVYPKDVGRKNKGLNGPNRGAFSEPFPEELSEESKTSDTATALPSFRSRSVEINSGKTVSFALAPKSNSTFINEAKSGSVEDKPPLPKASRTFSDRNSTTENSGPSFTWKNGRKEKKEDENEKEKDGSDSQPSRRRSVKELSSKFSSIDTPQPLANLDVSHDASSRSRSTGNISKPDPLTKTPIQGRKSENYGVENVPPNRTQSNYTVDKILVDRNSNISSSDLSTSLSVSERRKSFLNTNAAHESKDVGVKSAPLNQPGRLSKSTPSPIPPHSNKVTGTGAGELSEQQYSNILRQGLQRTQTQKGSEINSTKGTFMTRSSAVPAGSKTDVAPSRQVVSTGAFPTRRSEGPPNVTVKSSNRGSNVHPADKTISSQNSKQNELGSMTSLDERRKLYEAMKLI